MSVRSYPLRNTLQNFTYRSPILTGISLMVIGLFFKWIDTFVLRLDERLGEIILSKTLGFLLVITFIWAVGRSLGDIGLHSRRLGLSLLIGALPTILAFALAVGVDYLLSLQRQPQSELLFGAVDNKMGVAGGWAFAGFLLFGNIINAFMEEGLFRGLMIPLFRTRVRFWRANWMQAFLFGIWHLMWVVKYIQLGSIEEQGGIFMSSFSNSVPQLLMGLVWGYMYYKTGSLWSAWISHVITNSASNLVHIQTPGGLDAGFAVRMAMFTVLSLLSMFLVRYLAEKFDLPEVKPWRAKALAGEDDLGTAISQVAVD